MAASVPARLSGTVTAAASVGTRRRMNSATTMSTSAMEISRDTSTSSTLARMVAVRSDRVATWMPGGIHFRSCGSTAFTRSTVSITLAPAVLVIVSRMAGCWPCHAASLVLATPLMTVATSARRTVGAVVRLQHEAGIVLRLGDLPVQQQGFRAGRPREAADGAVDVGVADGGVHVLAAEARGLERGGVEAHAHGRLLGTVDLDLAHAVHLTEPLRQDGVGGVVELGRWRWCRWSG